MKLLYCKALFVLCAGILWRNAAAVVNDRNDSYKPSKRDAPVGSNGAGVLIEPPPDTFRENVEARISNFEATTPVFPLTAPPENYGPALVPPKKETSFGDKDSPAYSSYDLPPPQHASSFEHAHFPAPTFNFPKPAFPPPKPHYGPPPRPSYGPPPHPPKPSYVLYPKPSYGPPKPSFGPHRPHFEHPLPSGINFGSYRPDSIPAVKPVYGPPPRPVYGPPPKPNYGPVSFQSNFGSKLPAKFPPSSFSTSHFGASFKTGPPHSPHGIHSLPTPPVVSYDGWRPIKGPEFKDLSFHQLNTVEDHSALAQPDHSFGLFGGDLLPPLIPQSPAIYPAVSDSAQLLLDFPAAYSVPSTPQHHGAECDQSAGSQLGSNGCCGPAPTSLAHTPYENQGLEYGVPYGVPSGKQIEGPNLRPKSPVKFRPPVPPGLLESSGGHGSSQHSTFPGQSYIPPAVPEISKSNDNEETPSVDYSSKDTDYEVPSKPSGSLEAPHHPKPVDYHVQRPTHGKEPSQHFAPPPAAAVSLTGPNFSPDSFLHASAFAVQPNEHGSYFSGHQFGADYQPGFESVAPTAGNLLDFSNQGFQYNQWPHAEQQLAHDHQIVPGELLQSVLSTIEQPNAGFELSSVPHGGEYDAGEGLLTAGSDHVQYNATPDQVDEVLLGEQAGGAPLQRLAKEIIDKNKGGGVEKASNFTNGHTSSIDQNASVNAPDDNTSVTRKAAGLIKTRSFKLTDHSIFSRNSSYSTRSSAAATTPSTTS